MSQELSNNSVLPEKTAKKRFLLNSKLISLPLWVVLSFIMAQITLTIIAAFIKLVGINLESVNQSVLSLFITVFAYIFMLLFLIGIPWLARKKRTSLEDIGITRLPSWSDILLSPAGLVIYVLLSVLLGFVFSSLFPSVDLNQVQDTGFNNLSRNYEYYLAFVALVVLAPIAEEVIFRGYLFGKLKKYVPVWAAIIMTSITFGAIHGAWNLAIDTFALSIILCLLREITGNIWSSILLHMIKNGIAYYFLFINAALLTTLGG